MMSELSNEWKWVWTAVAVGSALVIFWVLYKMVLYKIGWGKTKAEAAVKKVEKSYAKEEIVMPLAGEILPIEQVPDPIFSEKLVGDGFAIEPIGETIYAPVNGKITQIYSNRDAITFKTKQDRNVILHIGIDSSNLKGVGITYEINEGDEVHAGQKIGTINFELVISRVTSIISPVIFPDLNENEKIVIKRSGQVTGGEKDVVVLEIS